MLAAFALQLVFVHANGRVALERAPGDAAYVLFDKGREPTHTPDGKRVLYWTHDGIVWADVDGGAHGLYRAGNLRSPRVSPDGTQLLWGEMVDGAWAVLRSPLARAEPKRVFRGKDGVYEPAWLPDGSGVIVHDLDSVYWVALDGKVTRTLPVGELTGGAGGTSSADRFVVCPTHPSLVLFSVENGEESSSLFTYDLETKVRTRLTAKGVLAFDPDWSRDGRAIYFRGSRAGKHPIRDGVLRIAADGSGLTRVAPGGEPAP
jgi:dipeptidyl aminopeptidase/acylaminoacyl peptidase